MLNIYIDTREQKPLEFTSDIVSTVQRTKLPYGDYACSINGEKCPIVFERKSLSDLYGTLGKGMSRFKKEINRSIEDGRKLVIIVEAIVEFGTIIILLSKDLIVVLRQDISVTYPSWPTPSMT